MTAYEDVIDDLEKRIAHGMAEYGTPLLPHNGRHALWDAYEEVMDMALYLRQVILEDTYPSASWTLDRAEFPGIGDVVIKDVRHGWVANDGSYRVGVMYEQVLKLMVHVRAELSTRGKHD